MRGVPGRIIHSRKILLHLVDIEEPLEEPVVNVGHPMNLLDGISTVESIGNGKDPLIGWLDQFLVDIVNIFVLLNCQPRTAFERSTTHLAEPHKLIINSPNSLLDSLFKRASNTHNLPDALHRAAQQLADATELFQIPARNLDDAIVERWFEACCRLFRDVVFDLVEWNAQAKFGGDEGEGIASRFRRECGRAGETGVDLSRI